MRKIAKKISLENFKSRMPSIVPAYDNEGKQHNFSHFVDLAKEPLVNYGMLPFDVQVDEDDSMGIYSGKLFTFKELSNIFRKLDGKYNHIIFEKCEKKISIENHEENFYKWLLKKCFPFFVFDIELQLYEAELNINDIKSFWKTSRLSLEEVGIWCKKMLRLKEKYNSALEIHCCERVEYQKRGGDYVLQSLQQWYDRVIERIVYDITDYPYNDLKYAVNDNDKTVLVKVLKENNDGGKEVVLHKFEIFEPKVRIFGNNRYIKYGEIDKNNNIINPQNLEIIDGILTIPCLFSSLDSVLVVSKPSFSVPLLLLNNMSNIGETTSICEPWERGYEYNQNILHQDLIDYSGGAMVYYNGDNWILKSYDNPGYMYSKKYMEMYFANESGMTYDELLNYRDEGNEDNIEYLGDAWERYIDYLPHFDKQEIETYTYKNDKLILNPNPFIMGNKYKIDTNENLGFCLYLDSIYPIMICDYVTINEKYYEVFYVYQEGDVKLNPFIYIDDKKTPIKDESKLSLTYCKPHKHCYKIHNGTFFKYKNILMNVEKEKKIDGYVTHNNENIYFRHGVHTDYGSILVTLTNTIGDYKTIEEIKKEKNNFQGYTTYVIDNEYYVIITTPYEVYNGKYISGYTTSKINELINDLKMATDDLGNVLNGLMPYKEISSTTTNGHLIFKDYVTQLNFNDWLSIPYIPKYVSQLSEMNELSNGNNLYWGNIIDKVIINYEINTVVEKEECEKIINAHTTEDTKMEDKTIDANNNEIQLHEINYSFTHTCETNESLKTIEKIMRESVYPLKNIVCTVEYYMGSLIEEKTVTVEFECKEYTNNDGIVSGITIEYGLFKNNEFNKNNDTYYGVKYTDVFNVEPKQCKFYYDDNNITILNYWDMKPYMQVYNNDTYNVNGIKEETSFFEFIIKPFELNYGYVYKTSENDTFYKVDMFNEYIDLISGDTTYKTQIYFKGVNKYFSYPLSDKSSLYKEYNYYCIYEEQQYYGKYDSNLNEFIIQIDEDESYCSKNMENSFFEHNVQNGEEKQLNIFCEIPLKLYLITQDGTCDDKYFDYTNDMSVAPVIIDENKIGLSLPENVQENIYIDRGTVRAIDYHLRLLEAKTLESLEQIGNGFFKFNSNNEIK